MSNRVLYFILSQVWLLASLFLDGRRGFVAVFIGIGWLAVEKWERMKREKTESFSFGPRKPWRKPEPFQED